jgi:uncharacterized membrane protein YjjB (DUF3815 family)
MTDFPSRAEIAAEPPRGRKEGGGPSIEDMLQAELELGALLYRAGATGGRINDSILALNQAMGGGRVTIGLDIENLRITLEKDGCRVQDEISFTSPTSLDAQALSRISYYLHSLPAGLEPARAREDIARLDVPRARPGVWHFAAMILFMVIFGFLAHADLWSLPIIAIAVCVALLVRELMAMVGMGYFLSILVGALASTLVAALLTVVLPTQTALMAMVVPCIILMPGFLLINGGWEIMRRHLQTGIPRTVFWLAALSMITLGLLLVLFFYAPPLQEVVYGMTMLEELVMFTLLGGMASLCFCIMVGAPAQAWIVCMLCGLAGRFVRTLIVLNGGDIAVGTFAAAITLSAIAVILCARVWPNVPIILPMVAASVQFLPSYYAILSLQGMSQIIHAGPGVAYPVVAATAYDGLLAVFIVSAIVFGTLIPLMAVEKRKKWY